MLLRNCVLTHSNTVALHGIPEPNDTDLDRAYSRNEGV